MIPSIGKIGQLLAMTAIIMIMIFAIKKVSKKVNIPLINTIVEEV